MSDDVEPALDIGLPDLDVEFVTEERPRRVRVVDNSLRPSKANIAAFWSKVIKSPTCWYWIGAISAPTGTGGSTSSVRTGNAQCLRIASR